MFGYLCQYLVFLATIVIISMILGRVPVWLLVFWTVWQSGIEIFQMKNLYGSGVPYMDFWNGLDLARISMQVLCICLSFGDNEVNINSAFALVVLLSWIGLLPYLKIYDTYRYLAELIKDCIMDVIPFLLVVAIMIIGFMFALYWRNLEYLEGTVGLMESFQIIFMNGFGDFSLAKENMSFIDIVIFYASTILICLLMMNLLIGILSEKLAEVVEQRSENKVKYAEKADMIFQIENLMFWNKTKA